MKLICVEEHILDPAIGAAAQGLVHAEAPYLPDWGSRVVDGRHVADSSRPHVISPAESARKALETGALRLAGMDTAGIDMQVLSYGGFPQLLPAAQSIELTRAANDKLAIAAQAHPTRFAGFATLPWQAPEEAARELERAVKELGLKGAPIEMPAGIISIRLKETVTNSTRRLREHIVIKIKPGSQSYENYIMLPRVCQAQRRAMGHNVVDRVIAACH